MRYPYTICFGLFVIGAFFLPLSHAQSTLIFAANYDAILVADESESRVQSRIEVRNERKFPIDFQTYKIHVQVSAVSEDGYRIDLLLYEKSGADWYQLNIDALSFEGSYGIPLEYKWNGAGVRLDLALVVSPARH